MKKSSVNTKSILSEVNRILGITDSYQAPDRMLQVVTSQNRQERDHIYQQLADLNDCDYSIDWFFEYFQEEHADRHQNKQDFTPPCIASIVHDVLHAGETEGQKITYDPAAGTGQLLIRNWWLERRKYMPWEYRPIDHLVVCSELSIKTVPFLLFNLSVRGICGMVFHMNTMTEEVFESYVLTNPTNDPLKYSNVNLLSEMQ